MSDNELETEPLNGSEHKHGTSGSEEDVGSFTRCNRRIVAVAVVGSGLALLGVLAAFVGSIGGDDVTPIGIHSSLGVISEHEQPEDMTIANVQSGVYKIKNAANDLYIDVLGGVELVRPYQNFDNIQLWNDPQAQQSRWWIFRTGVAAFNIQLDMKRTFSMSMNLTQDIGGYVSGLQLNDDQLSYHSQWRFIRVGSSSKYLIQNVRGGQFLGAEGDIPGSNIVVRKLLSNHGPGLQFQWHLEFIEEGRSAFHRGPTPNGTSLAYPSMSTYNILSPAKKLVINAAGGKHGKEAHMELNNDSMGQESQWAINAMGLGIYTIQSRSASTEYWSVAADGSVPENQTMHLHNSPLSAECQFSFYVDSDDQYLIRNIATQKYLTASGGESQQSDFQVSSLDTAARWVLQCLGPADMCSTNATASTLTCADGLGLTPIISTDCPDDTDLPNCDAVMAGDLCEGDGECGTEDDLDNCGHHDIYQKQMWPHKSKKKLIMLRKRFLCSNNRTVELRHIADESCYWDISENLTSGHQRRLQTADQTHGLLNSVNGLEHCVNWIRDKWGNFVNNKAGDGNEAESEDERELDAADGRRLSFEGVDLVTRPAAGTQWKLTRHHDNETASDFDAYQSTYNSEYLTGHEDKTTVGMDPSAFNGSQAVTEEVEDVEALPMCDSTDGSVSLSHACTCGVRHGFGHHGAACEAGEYCSIYDTAGWNDRCHPTPAEPPELDCETNFQNGTSNVCSRQFCIDLGLGCLAAEIFDSVSDSVVNNSGVVSWWRGVGVGLLAVSLVSLGLVKMAGGFRRRRAPPTPARVVTPRINGHTLTGQEYLDSVLALGP